MPDAIELLKTRRSVKPRDMTGPAPSAAELDTILTIGARVPDHGKLAPWRFILFEGDARSRAGEIIAGVFAGKNPQATQAEIEIEKRRLTDAPLVIGLVSFTRAHPKVPAHEQELSAGEPMEKPLYDVTAEEQQQRGIRPLPTTLIEAIKAFDADPLAKEVFGPTMHGMYSQYKHEEWERFHQSVTEWEKVEYLRFF